MQVIRYSLLIHATSAIILIHAILIHMYMAFWVKGSIKGMIEGKVSRRWAKKHHPALVSRCRTPGSDQRESRRDEVSLHGAKPAPEMSERVPDSQQFVISVSIESITPWRA
ncbi:formate dehydrogenase N subunit gamma [Klebsiella variicola]|uniref:Formate dehydrogenase N subunit gamma n=1 Tax=Klebsiella variicola TaxID=244366 RepID=A0A7H4MKW1_KLEVA|nr:formate dehydrogenase N subunit gamma [Klebsiella variicola]